MSGVELSFSVEKIYKSDHRYIGGTLIIVESDEIEGLLKNARYSGAYVSSNNIQSSKDFFQSQYIPEGDLRKREEYDSEEAYQNYLSNREQGDTTKEAFITTEYIDELSRRNSGKMIRCKINIFVSFSLAYIIMVSIMIIRSYNYTKKNVLRDIKDNFSIELEVEMYRNYYIKCAIFMLLINAFVIGVYFLFGRSYQLPLFGALEVGMTLASTIITGIICVSILKRKYYGE